MSGTENSATGTLEECLRLGAGFAAADHPTGVGMSQTSKVIAPGKHDARSAHDRAQAHRIHSR